MKEILIAVGVVVAAVLASAALAKYIEFRWEVKDLLNKYDEV